MLLVIPQQELDKINLNRCQQCRRSSSSLMYSYQSAHLGNRKDTKQLVSLEWTKQFNTMHLWELSNGISLTRTITWKYRWMDVRSWFLWLTTLVLRTLKVRMTMQLRMDYVKEAAITIIMIMAFHRLKKRFDRLLWVGSSIRNEVTWTIDVGSKLLLNELISCFLQI